jgi:hypothetical protein
LLGALDREALSLGLATTAGTVSHTGVGGLTLVAASADWRGDSAWPADNVRSIDLVTAQGKYLSASNQQNQDLFWGLRGGGGNFGVATVRVPAASGRSGHAGWRSHLFLRETRLPYSSSSSSTPPGTRRGQS